jgi:crotonobetainyl-CoA:carnitine CoA-transferase CaiB-like acyl-CoA transferase
MAGPLDGIRVLDLTAMASGPYATAVLGDQGADVIKVEPPGHGDLLREIGTTRGGLSAIFATLNRNKRSLVLDLKQPRGVELLLELANGVDVFVQNFRPGVAERMGVGEAAVRAASPGVVYVSISGFGERGPYAGRRVYDSIMQAYSGVAAQQADPDTGVPAFVRNIICDKGTALTTAQAITAALLARERGAAGQHLRISMLHASIAFLWPDAMQNHTFLPSDPSESILPHALPVIRQTADGFITLTAINDGEFERLCRALGRPELTREERFADAGTRARNAGALHDILNPITRALTTAELVKRLEAEDVPHAVINTPARIHEDPQVVANELLVELEHPSAGPMRLPRPVGDFEATPASLRRPAPSLGEHSNEILKAHGLGEDQIAALRETGVLG